MTAEKRIGLVCKKVGYQPATFEGLVSKAASFDVMPKQAFRVESVILKDGSSAIVRRVDVLNSLGWVHSVPFDVENGFGLFFPAGACVRIHVETLTDDHIRVAGALVLIVPEWGKRVVRGN